MKVNKILKETADGRTYKHVRNSLVSGCPLCPPHRGCNRWKGSKPDRSWKEYRKTQWKEE